MRWRHVIVSFFPFMTAVLLRCANLTGGSGSDVGNGLIMGSVMYASGSPSAGAVVCLRTPAYVGTGAPASMKNSPVFFTTLTDSNGKFTIEGTAPGPYVIEVNDRISSAVLIKTTVDTAAGDTVLLEKSILRPYGGISGVVDTPGMFKQSLWVQVRGLDRLAPVANDGKFVLADLPGGCFDLVCVGIDRTAPLCEVYDVSVQPGGKEPVRVPVAWRFSRRLYLNTTASGAGVAGAVMDFPALVRLTSANFNFSQARGTGADVRFTKADQTPLPYEIERWDSAAGSAEIWVRADTVFGGDSSHSITMSWGVSAGAAVALLSNAAAVFDTARGFQGVWHLSDEGASAAYDATVNHYDGTPAGTGAVSAAPGVIAAARAFDGSSYITMPNTASGKLNLPQNGNYSLSLWVYVDTIDTVWHAIAGKGHEQFYLKLKCFGNNRATWEFVEFQDGVGWDFTEDSVPPAPGGKQWVNITGIREAGQQRLYINGTLVSSAVKLMGGNYARNTGDDFTIGRHARLVTIPYYEGWDYFKGKVDEVRVANGVLSQDWIKLCYMNQRADDKLVVFKFNK